MFKIQNSQEWLNVEEYARKILEIKYSQRPRISYEHYRFSSFIHPLSPVQQSTPDQIQCKQFLCSHPHSQFVDNYFNLNQTISTIQNTILYRVTQDDQHPVLYQNQVAFRLLKKYKQINHSIQKFKLQQKTKCTDKSIDGEENSIVVFQKLTEDLTKMIKSLKKSHLESSLKNYLSSLGVEKNQTVRKKLGNKTRNKLQQFTNTKIYRPIYSQSSKNEQENYGLSGIKTKNLIAKAKALEFEKQKTEIIRKSMCPFKPSPLTPKPTNEWKKEGKMVESQTMVSRNTRLEEVERYSRSKSKQKKCRSKSKKKYLKKVR